MKRVVALISLLLLTLPFVVGADVAPGDLVGRWSFDETTPWGSTVNAVKDTAPASPGNEAHGTAFGAIWEVGGKKGNAAIFDGINDYISIPSTNQLTPTTSISVAGWFKVNEIPGGSTVITGSMVSKRDGYVLSPNQDRSISFFVKTSNGWRVATTPIATLEVGAWQHIVGTYDGSVIKVYVDGVERASLAASGNLEHNSEPICVGHDYCGSVQDETNRYFPGSIDELMIYRKALSAQEVVQLRQASVSSTPGAACDVGDQAILKLYGESNSHVAAGNDSDASYSICFKSLFPNEPLPSTRYPYACVPDAINPLNVILRASGVTNAHAEKSTLSTAGYRPLCYGELTCTLMNAGEACPAQNRLVVALSGTTNAHASVIASALYPYRVCCSLNGPQISAVEWQSTDGQKIAGTGSPYDATTPYPFVVNGKAKVVVKTRNINLAGLQGFRIEVRDIDKDMDVVDDQTDDLASGTLSPIAGSARVSGTKCIEATGIGCDGSVEFEWVFSDTDAGMKKMYNTQASAKEDELAITAFRFELVGKVLPGSVATSPRESEILYTQVGTGWQCNLDKAKSKNLENGITYSTIKTIDSVANYRELRRIAGKACKGPDGQTGGLSSSGARTSVDDCCPTGMQCTDDGCIITGINQCQDYVSQDACNKDAANIWNNKPSYVVLSTCSQAKYEQRCKWTSRAEAESRPSPTPVPAGKDGICEYGVRQLSSSSSSGAWGSEIASCLYTYAPQDACGEDNYQTVTIFATRAGDFNQLSCNDPLNNCEGGVQRIPCGQPAVELPFFGALQFIGALISIAIVYFIMFHFRVIRRVLTRRR